MYTKNFYLQSPHIFSTGLPNINYETKLRIIYMALLIKTVESI